MLVLIMQSQLATKIDKKVKQAVDALCHNRGYKMNRFVEEALLDKLEELEDIADIQALRKEPTRLLHDVINNLKAHGRL